MTSFPCTFVALKGIHSSPLFLISTYENTAVQEDAVFIGKQIWLPELRLRIRDILVRIRIRVSIPLSNGSGSGSCYFRQWPSRWQISKINFFLRLFAYYPYFFKLHLHRFSKVIKKSQNRRKYSRFFLLFLLDYRRIRIRTSYYWIRIRIQEAQKHTGPADPDPQHCRTYFSPFRRSLNFALLLTAYR